MPPTLETLYKHTRLEGTCRIWEGALASSGRPFISKKTWGCSYARQYSYSTTGKTIKPFTIMYSTCKNPLCITAEHLTYEPDRTVLIEEFFSQVDKTKGLSPDITKAHLGNCHWWIGCQNHSYGALNITKWGESLAHRWIYKLSHNLKELDSKITVNHLCNNPECVNPTHLSYNLGETWNKSNMIQLIQEKRNHNQRFTPEQIPEIRMRILAGESTAELCREYKCSKPTIADIKYNRSFIDPTYTPPPKQVSRYHP